MAQSCFVQTCDQVITGRRFAYERTLDIVQSEEYLEDSDFDEIRRHFDVLKKKTGEPASTFNIQRKNQHSKWSPINTKTTSKPISQKYNLKKTVLPDDTYFDIPTTHQVSTEWKPITTKSNPIQQKSRYEYHNYKYKRDIDPNDNIADIYDSNTREQVSNRMERQFPDTRLEEEPTIQEEDLFELKLFDDSPPPDPDSDSDYEMPLRAAQAAAAAASSVGMVGGMMLMTELSFQDSGVATGGSAAVGAPGGGALPSNSLIPTLSLSLALIAATALVPVAVFPPFATPRTIPAVAVVFSEPRDMTLTVRKQDVRRLYHEIRKRSIGKYQKYNVGNQIVKLPSFGHLNYALKSAKSNTVGHLKNLWNSLKSIWLGASTAELPTYDEIKYALNNTETRKVAILTKVHNFLRNFRKWIAKKMFNKLSPGMKRFVKKIGRIEARIQKKMICLRPRLQRRYGKLVYPEGLTVKAIKYQKEEFFDFINFGNAEDEEVEYIEDCFDDMERPEFGWRVKVTLMDDEPCTIDPKNLEMSTCKLSSASESDLLEALDTGDLNHHYAQSRQTGEEFRSSAPPDCRYRYICGDTNPLTPVSVTPAQANPVTENPVTANPVIANPVTAENPAVVNTAQALQVIADPVTTNPVVLTNTAQIVPVQTNPVQANPVQENTAGTDLTQADLGTRGALNGEPINSQPQIQEIPDSIAQSQIDLGKVTTKNPTTTHVKKNQAEPAQQNPDQVRKQETLSTNFLQIPVESKPSQQIWFATKPAEIYQGPEIQADSRIDIENRVFTDTSNLRSNVEYDKENILRNTANRKDVPANERIVVTDISSINIGSASDIKINYAKVPDGSENIASLEANIENNSANVANINSDVINISSAQLNKNTMWALFQSLFNPNQQNQFQISPDQNIPLQETSLKNSGKAQESQNQKFAPTQTLSSSQLTLDPYKFNIFVYNDNNYNTQNNYHIYDKKKNS